MKKLHLLIYALILTVPFTAHTRLIEIIAEDGTLINVSDSQTVQDFFNKCRQDRHCTSAQHLALDFNNKLIKEGSSEADRTLWDLKWMSSANKASVVTLQYPQRPHSSNYLASLLTNYAQQPNALIEVEAPNGRIKKCSLNETPAYFFRKCRNSGDCPNNAPMTLQFGNFEIKENSQAANKPFGSFNTDSGFAQVKKR